MALFASTSQSYLIMESLDLTNRYLAEGYRERLEGFVRRVAILKQRLTKAGYTLIGNEPLKITVKTKPYGYTGNELAVVLEAENMICEFSDPDYVVLMLTPELSDQALARIEEVLTGLERKKEILTIIPELPVPDKRFTPREALFLPGKREPIDQCLGRVLVSPSVSCPPAIPVVVCGEIIDEASIEVFNYYGIEACVVY
jgi:arginine/lysine/ornithine decarboxylase